MMWKRRKISPHKGVVATFKYRPLGSLLLEESHHLLEKIALSRTSTVLIAL
jgi:hypothetical protein